MAALRFFSTFYLIVFAVVWKMVKGNSVETCQSISNSTITTMQDNRHKYFDLNEGADITCSNKTWREMIYSIWKVKLTGRLCCVAFHINGSRHDTCENGMELRNGTSGESYLHIPQFTLGNQGVYLCETAYWGGTYNAEITVSARVPPQIFSRLEELHNGTVAVCSAVEGNPAASISWRTQWNSTANQTSTHNPNGTYTVESRLVLPGRVSRENLSCIVTHPSWPGGFKEVQFSDPKAGHVAQWIGLSVVSVCILAAFCLTWKLISKIRKRRETSSPSPTPPKVVQRVQEVEELEPYASYVQRINSIYNSSAELCRH
ncbi:cell surface glycoprotein CD200 receptor 1-like [Brienomyrus brachyistius]|uniref:cell surface glycoprotein CD200 receptor 1-like n=1 Tax=Brienomyrus brachyistius TaxID=42636 RepID=UPI0020B2729F|nr:cell surface glycoprotein CD200 receptor 1-like [Brienomyrus brachyistius]